MKNKNRDSGFGIRDSGDSKRREEGKDKGRKPEVPKIPEVAGRGGLDPVRFGDWEIAGKCVDF